MRIIKRYSNRKLYDTEDKRYITLEQIAQLVRDGQDIKVIENQTGEDLTNVTLSQILLEQEKRKEGKLPKQFLFDLIQRSSTTVADFWRKNVLHYFDHAFMSEEKIDEDVEALIQAGEIEQEEASELREEIKVRSTGLKEKLDEAVEQRVQALLKTLNLPSKGEIDRLTARVEELTRLVDELSQVRGAVED